MTMAQPADDEIGGCWVWHFYNKMACLGGVVTRTSNTSGSCSHQVWPGSYTIGSEEDGGDKLRVQECLDLALGISARREE